MMAGSILSATDPVAVVALLKELGASPKFGTLIEGESLLNDGTAMVFYMLFYDICIGKEATPQTVVTGFIRMAGGGPLLGILFGLLSCLWLRRVIRDETLVCIITFLACYLVFYIAEFTDVKVSGILALVVLGLFMSAYGKTNISSQAEHAGYFKS
jgi:NhaP-type Na+/H+ or K+/H+ antiporter